MGRCAVRYWQPDERVRPYILSYSHYVVGEKRGVPVTEPFYASWANLRITLGQRGWSFSIGNRHYPHVPGIALFGPTSRLGSGSSEGEVAWGAGISPMGWARLVRRNAAAYADAVTPAERLGPLDLAGLAADLRGGADPVATFDAFFLARLAEAPPEPPEVGLLFTLLADPAITTVHDLVERAGVAPARLSRLVPQHFGFTPKLLLRRLRFTRALMGVKALPRGQWAEALAGSGYWDQAHFLRDCQAFLGMPLNQFIALPKTMGEEAFRLRSAVLGAPVQALQMPPV